VTAGQGAQIDTTTAAGRLVFRDLAPVRPHRPARQVGDGVDVAPSSSFAAAHFESVSMHVCWQIRPTPLGRSAGTVRGRVPR